jgi:hypothetical protein
MEKPAALWTTISLDVDRLVPFLGHKLRGEENSFAKRIPLFPRRAEGLVIRPGTLRLRKPDGAGVRDVLRVTQHDRV